MGVLDYFRPISTWTAERVRELLRDRRPEEYNLVDVRQLAEYEQGHLPGARLIPLGELGEHSDELDPKKLTITYCARGLRSRAAAAQLSGLGFGEVYSLEGGMNAWKGLVAEGIPEAGTAYFSSASTPEELTALAWLLEEGTRTFYQRVAGFLVDSEAVALFEGLTAAEEHHKASLLSVYCALSGKTPDEGFPHSVLSPEPPDLVMEGGMRLDEALPWAKGRGVQDVLDLSISLEANSYDLYIKMGRAMEEPKAKRVFEVLVGEEKEHLHRLASLLERRL